MCVQRAPIESISINNNQYSLNIYKQIFFLPGATWKAPQIYNIGRAAASTTCHFRMSCYLTSQYVHINMFTSATTESTPPQVSLPESRVPLNRLARNALNNHVQFLRSYHVW